MNIPLFKPYITNDEFVALQRTLKSGKLTRGNEVEAFEKEFAQYVEKKFAIAVNSGTSGLHVAVRALGWRKGDEVITTPFSYISSSNALLYENVTPVFVDIDPHTLNIDPSKIEKKITNNTKGIMAVHILGLPVAFNPLKKIKEEYGFQIIEDACEAIGRPSEHFNVSTLGDISVYGFHENKQITTLGEGGMIVTDNRDLAEICRSMRDQGRSTNKEWIKNVILGFNFRMTEAQAAFGREQLKKIDKMLTRRRDIAQRYSVLLEDVKDITIPVVESSERSWFVYYIILDDPSMRAQVVNKLNKANICTSTNYFPPIYNFPMYRGSNRACIHSESISERLLVLPMYYEMKNDEIDRVVSELKKALGY